MKSNKYDVCKDGLLAVKRIDDLQDHERKPRPYTRKNKRYWNEEIKEQHRKRERLSMIPREISQHDIDNLTDMQVREKLKQLKCNSRVRCPNKLRQLLKDKLYATQSVLN